MQSKRILIVALFALLISTDGLFANYAFKKKVKTVCQSYRITVESTQFSLGENDFLIELESGRNNFEMVMLVGFAAAGHAIEHQIQMGKANAYTPENVTVNVAAPVSKGETSMFIATCSKKMAIDLANGTMDSSDFMQKINMEIQ
ncbi:MAG: hypothetical protein HOC41_06085 [Candidatus Marinimicrobia bacterium]|jgi:hypothetical protein|nr:hypothetical protein [Candidatus Neomarinimicrobiota bacterium]MBT3945768.1 hypothetical protein [Candidatus Neomarinimicrobiota bacterium]MBT4155543.1 hypothetical protein [Candidatus Neomarinimicrobiota bacterium]MBT4555234.1 hypothetical protein [Candidatus Neomarinimicrobiota bacterium]MBT4752687.1 hypothetical protein [Candidatus Neomarinimicrobiota bacterium]|tara:strand:- start:12117 stop:12551 length:435 start_codon:yes stop_codon:yes gene_type:complete